MSVPQHHHDCHHRHCDFCNHIPSSPPLPALADLGASAAAAELLQPRFCRHRSLSGCPVRARCTPRGMTACTAAGQDRGQGPAERQGHLPCTAGPGEVQGDRCGAHRRGQEGAGGVRHPGLRPPHSAGRIHRFAHKLESSFIGHGAPGLGAAGGLQHRLHR